MDTKIWNPCYGDREGGETWRRKGALNSRRSKRRLSSWMGQAAKKQGRTEPVRNIFLWACRILGAWAWVCEAWGGGLGIGGLRGHTAT